MFTRYFKTAIMGAIGFVAGRFYDQRKNIPVACPPIEHAPTITELVPPVTATIVTPFLPNPFIVGCCGLLLIGIALVYHIPEYLQDGFFSFASDSVHGYWVSRMVPGWLATCIKFILPVGLKIYYRRRSEGLRRILEQTHVDSAYDTGFRCGYQECREICRETTKEKLKAMKGHFVREMARRERNARESEEEKSRMEATLFSSERAQLKKTIQDLRSAQDTIEAEIQIRVNEARADGHNLGFQEGSLRERGIADGERTRHAELVARLQEQIVQKFEEGKAEGVRHAGANQPAVLGEVHNLTELPGTARLASGSASQSSHESRILESTNPAILIDQNRELKALVDEQRNNITKNVEANREVRRLREACRALELHSEQLWRQCSELGQETKDLKVQRDEKLNMVSSLEQQLKALSSSRAVSDKAWHSEC